MSAHECYELLVGEIGISPDRFLYELLNWEIIAIIKGYRRRSRPLWEAIRLGAYFIMSATANLDKAGIKSDQDLIRFPWEKKNDDLPDDEEINKIREELQNLNKKKL